MKYLLLLILTLTPQILNKEVTIDFENQCRVGSEYTKQLNWVSEQPIDITEGHFSMKQETNNINFELKASIQGYLNLATGVPSLLIHKDSVPLNYDFTPKPSDECLLFNYPELKTGSDISCTYTNARYSITSKSFVNKSYKKELAVGHYVVGLTEQGRFEVNDVFRNEFKYRDDHSFMEAFKMNFKQFDQLLIKDFFIGDLETPSKGIFSILTEEQLLIFKFQDAHLLIEFEKAESYDLKALDIYLDGLRNVFYLNTECFAILKNGFYKLTKKSDVWEQKFYDKFNIDGEVVDLVDIDAAINMMIGCISIKGYGLVFFDLSEKEDFKTLKTFKHRNTIGIVTTGHSINSFNVGVLIDNQSDENVKEFFLELTFNAINTLDKGDIMLSRILISSEKVESVQTDIQGMATTFLMGSNVYILPRNINGLNSLPIYVYKNASHGKKIGFVGVFFNIPDKFSSFESKVIMFRLVKHEMEEDEVVAFQNTPENFESFKCNFKKHGSYMAQVTKQTLDLNGNVQLKNTKFSIIIYSDEKTEEEKKKEEEEERRQKDEDGNNTEESSNTTLIVIIIVVSIIVIVCLIAIVLYLRRKKRLVSDNLVTGNYQLAA
jgi:hypothetical protein